MARITALLMRRFSEIDSRAHLSAEDQAAVISLTEARLRAVDRVQRQQQIDGEIIHRSQVAQFYAALSGVLRRRLPDDLLVLVRDDLRAVLESRPDWAGFGE